jgi:ABC-type transport system substrate-binding protein
LYALFDGYFIAAMPSLPLFAPSYTYVQTSRVKGYQPQLMFAASGRFSKVEEWFIEKRVP